MVLVYMPGPTGNKLRYFYYRRVLKSCGKNVIIDTGVHISGAKWISIGDNVHIDKGCIISTGKNLTGKITRKENTNYDGQEGEITIGNNIHIVQSCILMGYGGIKIDDHSVLSSGCKIYSLTNTAYDLKNKSAVVSIMPYSSAPFLLSPVVLSKNVWLGLNTIVMPSVSVGDNSFSTANSVLINSFTHNSYIAGQPAKKIRDRFIKKQSNV